MAANDDGMRSEAGDADFDPSVWQNGLFSVMGGGSGASSNGAAAVDLQTPKKTGPNTKLDLKEKFKCAICMVLKSIAERVPGHQWDRECKRARDALYRLAVKQNELDWWDQCLGDSKMMKFAVLDYIKQNPSGGGRGSKRSNGYKICELKDMPLLLGKT